MIETHSTEEFKVRALDLINDLREPLHAVTGFAELMGESAVDPEILTVFNAISSETARMVETVTQLTDLLTEPVTGAESGVERRRPTRQPQSILVVDDSPVNRLLTRAQLENLGYEVEVVSSGYEALDFLQRASPDLILLDWHMPGMDGLETARRIRALEVDSGHLRTPIIALTARAMVGDREKCLAAGMDDFLSKPASIDDLAHAVSIWIEANPPTPSDLDLGPSTPAPDLIEDATLDELGRDLGDPALVDGLLRTFLEEFEGRRSGLLRGLELGDRDLLRQIAHTLKSTSGLLGARRLSERSLHLERTISDTEDVEGLVQELVEIADLTAEAIRSRLDDLGPPEREAGS